MAGTFECEVVAWYLCVNLLLAFLLGGGEGSGDRRQGEERSNRITKSAPGTTHVPLHTYM